MPVSGSIQRAQRIIEADCANVDQLEHKFLNATGNFANNSQAIMARTLHGAFLHLFAHQPKGVTVEPEQLL